MTKRFCVIGNFSGRNAGDAAILGALLEDISRAYPRVHFEIPTIRPAFIRSHYGNFPVTPVGMMPWHLSVKIFGLPLIRSIMRSDIVLVTDAILFDRLLFDPVFNYLSTLALVLPGARRRGKPIVLYNVSLGPVFTRVGRWCLNRVLDAADEIVLRDTESLNEIPADFPGRDKIRRGADCALNVVPASSERTDEVLRHEGVDPDRPFITFNVNSYIGEFLAGTNRRFSKRQFLELMASCITKILQELPVAVVLVVTQHMDTGVARNVQALVGKQEGRLRLISNRTHTYQELAGVLSRADIHVGMRTHSLILASSAPTPVVALVVTPKTRGFMHSIRQQSRALELDQLDEKRVLGTIRETWRHRAEIKEELRRIIDIEKDRARAATAYLAPYLDHPPSRVGPT